MDFLGNVLLSAPKQGKDHEARQKQETQGQGLDQFVNWGFWFPQFVQKCPKQSQKEDISNKLQT